MPFCATASCTPTPSIVMLKLSTEMGLTGSLKLTTTLVPLGWALTEITLGPCVSGLTVTLAGWQRVEPSELVASIS